MTPKNIASRLLLKRKAKQTLYKLSIGKKYAFLDGATGKIYFELSKEQSENVSNIFLSKVECDCLNEVRRVFSPTVWIFKGIIK